MVEHRPVKAIVAGSSPASGAKEFLINLRELDREPYSAKQILNKSRILDSYAQRCALVGGQPVAL